MPTLITMEDIQPYLQPRPLDAHKGLFGHVLVVGGDIGMPGAVRLAGEAALRVGAGLVSVCTRPAHVFIVVSGRPELLCYGTHISLRTVKRLLAAATVVAVGPGLGQSTWSKRLLQAVFASKLPLVIDADGLNLLARMRTLPPSPAYILTPHPGEAARMLGMSTADIQNNRTQAVSLLQQKFGGVVVLKGAGTLVGAADQDLVQCGAGNPAMASPGMGDVLTGMIAGLLAQGLSPWEAAQAGVVLHAHAADRAVAKQRRRSLLASDLFDEL